MVDRGRAVSANIACWDTLQDHRVSAADDVTVGSRDECEYCACAMSIQGTGRSATGDLYDTERDIDAVKKKLQRVSPMVSCNNAQGGGLWNEYSDRRVTKL